MTKEVMQQAEPVAWMFQHDETGRMNYVSNDGMNTPELFLKGNPRYALVCPLYTTTPQPKQKPMHPELRKMWEDYFDKCFRAQPEQEPTCPECKAKVLYECVACSSNNYPRIEAQLKGKNL